MARHPRYEEAGATHHVVAQGNGRRPFVLDDADREAYLRRFRTVARERGWEVHAEALLDTHHHAVVTTPAPDLGRGLRLVLGGHAAWFNARHRRTGSVFVDRYWSRRSEAHLVRACIYVLVNPVAAGLASHPSRWRWSSWDDLVDSGCSPAVAAATGGTREFLALVEQAVERIREIPPRTSTDLWRAVPGWPDVRGRG